MEAVYNVAIFHHRPCSVWSVNPALTLLSGLVQVERHSGRSTNTWVELYDDISGVLIQDRQMLVEEPDGIESNCGSQNEFKLRLAHFSVKGYLLSEDITQGEASMYALDTGLAQSFLAQACFEYILHCFEYSKFTPGDTANDYPLCVYAMCYGIRHQVLAEHQSGDHHLKGRLHFQSWSRTDRSLLNFRH